MSLATVMPVGTRIYYYCHEQCKELKFIYFTDNPLSSLINEVFFSSKKQVTDGFYRQTKPSLAYRQERPPVSYR